MALREWVYVDESGIGDNDHYCLVAGYAASVRRWNRFNREWKAVLNKPQYRIAKGFHSKVFFNRKTIKDSRVNPYLDWSDAKADSLLNELLMVITRSGIVTVGGAVDIDVFSSYSFVERCVMVGYIPESIRRKNRAPQPYHLAMRVLIEDVVQRVPPLTEVHLVISEQRELQQRALDGYAQLKEAWVNSDQGRMRRYGEKLKSIRIESPLDTPALQAADLFANRTYYNLQRGLQVNAWNQKIINQLTRRTPRRGIRVANALSIEAMLSDAMSDELRRRARAAGEPPS